MTLNRVLAWASVGLGVALAIQVAYAFYLVSLPPEPVRLHASWVNLANTLEEGLDQSDHVVVGKVLSVSQGPDIVVNAADEPGGVDSVPTQIVKIEVEEALKGAPGAEVELLQTGQATDATLIPPGEVDQDLKPSKGRDKLIVPSAGDQRATILEDDPPYQPGEKYVLLLKDMQGSPAGVQGSSSSGMKRALAPEGRYQVTKGNKLKPTTQRRGFAPNWVGRDLDDFKKQVAGHVGNP